MGNPKGKQKQDSNKMKRKQYDEENMKKAIALVKDEKTGCLIKVLKYVKFLK